LGLKGGKKREVFFKHRNLASVKPQCRSKRYKRKEREWVKSIKVPYNGKKSLSEEGGRSFIATRKVVMWGELDFVPRGEKECCTDKISVRPCRKKGWGFQTSTPRGNAKGKSKKLGQWLDEKS